MIKQRMPVRYSFFAGTFLTRNAVNGMMIPIAREYPLVIHWPVETLIPKYSTTGGKAVVIAVESMEITTPEIITLINICIRFLSLTSITTVFPNPSYFLFIIRSAGDCPFRRSHTIHHISLRSVLKPSPFSCSEPPYTQKRVRSSR